jgi:hypothetical protein
MQAIHLGGISPHLRLLALQEDTSRTERDGDRQEADRIGERVEVARAYQRSEIQQAQEEREDASMWSDIAGTMKTVSIVAASAAAIVATGGGGAPAVIVAAGAAMKLGAKVGEETGLIDGDVAGALDLGGTVAMAGGAAWGTFAAGQAASAAASCAAEGASTASSCSTLATVVEGARWTSTGAGAVAGYASKRADDHTSNAVDHDGNVHAAGSAGDAAQADREAVIDRSGRLASHERWLVGHAAQAVDSENQGTAGVIGNIGRMR